jgi:putative nucleotidyltransferase with HDIG domain
MRTTMQSLRMISEAGNDLDVQLSLSDVLGRVLEWAERIFNLRACAVLLFDDASGTLRIAASRGYRPEVVAGFRARPGEGAAGRAFLGRKPITAADMRALPDSETGLDGASCQMAVPLVTQGRAIGVLDGEAVRDAPFTEDDVDLFELFGAHVTAAVQNSTLLEKARADASRLDLRTRDLEALNEAGMRLATFTDFDALVRGVMATARRALPFRTCALLLLDGEELVVRGLFGFDNGIDVGLRLQRGHGVSWRCIESAAPILVDDVAEDPDYVLGLRGCRCEMAAPILGPSGPVGVFTAESPKPHAFNEDSLSLFATFAHQVAAAIENTRLHETNRHTFYQTIRALAQALEQRDSYTMGHSERVTRYALRIATFLGVTERDRDVIQQAGLLHDIGKIGVRDAVLLKPGRLTGEEREDIERHPIIGDSILHPVSFLGEALDAVLHHHEHWDGTGYPSGLAGDRIPLVARVIAVADTYDAMTSRRPYRDAMTHEAAVAEIRRYSCTQFDPAVVEAFAATVGRGA